MRKFLFIIILLLPGAIIIWLATVPIGGPFVGPVVDTSDWRPLLFVTGTDRLLFVRRPFSRITISNPNALDIVPISDRRLVLTAIKQGFSTIDLFDSDGKSIISFLAIAIDGWFLLTILIAPPLAFVFVAVLMPRAEKHRPSPPQVLPNAPSADWGKQEEFFQLAVMGFFVGLVLLTAYFVASWGVSPQIASNPVRESPAVGPR